MQKMEWLCRQEPQALQCYPFLFEFHSLWKIFLERIASQPQNASALLEVFKLFPQHYAPQFELSLLEVMFRTLLAPLTEKKKLAKAFFTIFEALPTPSSASIDSMEISSSQLQLLRSAAKYELQKTSERLQNLLYSSMFELAEGFQQYVLQIVLKGVFVTKKDEEMQQHLQVLLEKSQRNEHHLLTLLQAIERIERSKRVRSILQKLLESSLKEQRSQKIADCIRRILKPPPSFFKKIANKILEHM